MCLSFWALEIKVILEVWRHTCLFLGLKGELILTTTNKQRKYLICIRKEFNTSFEKTQGLYNVNINKCCIELRNGQINVFLSTEKLPTKQVCQQERFWVSNTIAALDNFKIACNIDS